MFSLSRQLIVGGGLGLVSLLVILPSTIGYSSQDQDRIIEIRSTPNEPVRINVVKTKRGVVKVSKNLAVMTTGSKA